jgi:hypothetical protein
VHRSVFTLVVEAGVKVMMGEKRVRQEALFYEFWLERHVSETHLLRAIDRFVELDGVRRGSWFRSTAPSAGRRSILN